MHVKNVKQNERNIETLEHVLIEYPEYKKERKYFEPEMIRRIGNREWEEIKQNED